jgi:pimeloyl-ACP methyl ester carboxylesterase
VPAVLHLEDGRRVGVAEWGAPSGWPVLVAHGTPGSALWRPTGPSLARLEGLGVRLITMSRPGYGASDRLPGRTVASWAADAAGALALVGASGPIGVLGVSGGGPHALACAARVPGVTAVSVLAGAGDLRDEAAFVGMAPASAAVWRSAFEEGGALEVMIGRISAGMQRRPPEEVATSVLTQFPASLVDAMTADPQLARMMVDDLVEAFAGGGLGWLDDARAFRSAWGFDLAELSVPVQLVHGAADEFVPLHQAEQLARAIPDATCIVGAGAGHVDTVADRFDDAIDWLLAQR